MSRPSGEKTPSSSCPWDRARKGAPPAKGAQRGVWNGQAHLVERKRPSGDQLIGVWSASLPRVHELLGPPPASDRMTICEVPEGLDGGAPLRNARHEPSGDQTGE